MIAQLTGRVASIEADRCVVDVAGVGYLLHASTRTLAALPSGQTATVLTEMQVREDAITLYGFADPAEREWFRLLLTVQGVGARVALNILSALSPRELVGAIQAGDRAAVSRASGVGAKLAIRLLTELREKAGAMPVGAGFTSAIPLAEQGVTAEALSALLNLGIRRPEAQAAIAGIIAREPEADLSTVIRDALRALSPA